MSYDNWLNGLDEAGLWAALAPQDKTPLIDLLTAGDDATWAAGGVWHVDGEDLAEGEVQTWLDAMASPLLDCGVDLSVTTTAGPYDPGSPGYRLSINGTELTLYDFTPDSVNVPASEDPWTDCTIRPAAAVNQLLERAGSDHRVAIFWPGGNDGRAVLAPTQIFTSLANIPGSDDWDMTVPTTSSS